jgi:hypothetical protein
MLHPVTIICRVFLGVKLIKWPPALYKVEIILNFHTRILTFNFNDNIQIYWTPVSNCTDMTCRQRERQNPLYDLTFMNSVYRHSTRYFTYKHKSDWITIFKFSKAVFPKQTYLKVPYTVHYSQQNNATYQHCSNDGNRVWCINLHCRINCKTACIKTNVQHSSDTIKYIL